MARSPRVREGSRTARVLGESNGALWKFELEETVIELPLSGAAGRCVWTFADTIGCTRITQRWTLEGEQADAYAKAVAAGLEAGIPTGMTKLCRTIEDAARFDKPSQSGG